MRGNYRAAGMSRTKKVTSRDGNWVKRDSSSGAIVFVGSSDKSLDQRIDEKWTKIRSSNALLKSRLEVARKK
ncbi:hypothetical protein [Aneurinibacillus thermoaerophilus]|jgi:hypothetical protein|uniref:hypothetical protein n=1 Tax=Aneurinibacillus thermoaerophilus TaxID=143495 RepID=UPI002E246134|nr:hypothetical protein [Aneurinibacillus thermoaerophilus]